MNENSHSNQLEDLLIAIGSTAEASYEFFKKLSSSGFNETQALYLTRGFIQSLITGRKE